MDFSLRYAVLGITRDCTPAEIKQAYYKIAAIYHPDKALSETPQAAARFKAITSAYTVLRDPFLRSQYDVFRDLSNVGNSHRIRHWMAIHRPMEVLEAGPQ
jgi:DnaJ-class molecular chaperone